MSSFELLSRLEPAFGKIEEAVKNDHEFQASANGHAVAFGITADDNTKPVIVTVENGRIQLDSGPHLKPSFTLSARTEHWEEFFEAVPKRPFQSYWGMLRILGKVEGVEIVGDVAAFGRYARLWRIILDRIRDALHGQDTAYRPEDVVVDFDEEDSIVGRYITAEQPRWGRCKIFYETAGSGPQDILFLHTAGSDSRQYHALMEDKQLRRRCTMYAFDLPGHGRSFLGSKQMPENFTNDEEQYVGIIGQVIQKLKLKKPIVSGASMAGHVCLAVALRAKELGVSGVIPCEGCDHLPAAAAIYDMPGDPAILDPERVCGMIAPTAPAENKRLIWWTYSSQGVQVFNGDLRFYFRGWDGRDRMQNIDTSICPVYMLTGEFDYSCTAEASEATAKKIPGAKFEKMIGLGHFPMSEDTKAFIPYLTKGIEYIQTHLGSSSRS